MKKTLTFKVNAFYKFLLYKIRFYIATVNAVFNGLFVEFIIKFLLYFRNLPYISPFSPIFCTSSRLVLMFLFLIFFKIFSSAIADIFHSHNNEILNRII